MKNNVFILALEPLETRYTSQWIYTFPNTIETFLGDQNLTEYYDIITLTGDQLHTSTKTTDGAFLNFIDTNYWKNTQMNRFIQMVQHGQVHVGDKVIFMDAWHNGILQIKYMSDLMNLKLDIYSLWHAGSYDPQDFLGRKIKKKNWSYSAELAYFYASTKNFFATQYHLNLFIDTLKPKIQDVINKAFVVGFPFDYLQDICKPIEIDKKENIILFPHRIAPEKQPEIFEDLASSLPDYKFIFCQKEHLTKDMYYDLLKRAKVVFSANLQETLGISCYEAVLCNTLPFVPERLSYKEMYLGQTYCSCYTESFEGYLKTKEQFVFLLKEMLKDYDKIIISKTNFHVVKEHLKQFFTSTKMLNQIFDIKE